ncbi:MAG: hypothetical protein IIU80_03590 [Clostridia bacterium]|nr:hypothetical protein [Clostridia bacterium]
MNIDNERKIIPDPDFEGFNGIYAGGTYVMPPSQHNLTALGRYMTETGKKFHELTEEEVEQFRYKK